MEECTGNLHKEFEGGLTDYGHAGLCVRAAQAEGSGTSHDDGL